MEIESGWKAVAIVLDGVVVPAPDGFQAETATRRMFVPYSRTRCPAEALAICKTEGLVADKLDSMSAEDADCWYAITLPRMREPLN